MYLILKDCIIICVVLIFFFFKNVSNLYFIFGYKFGFFNLINSFLLYFKYNESILFNVGICFFLKVIFL